jgi:hypothetical protein
MELMKIVARCRIAALAAVICSTFLTVSLSLAQPNSEAQSQEESLKRFLQAMDNDRRTRYIAAFSDLDEDGAPEAIVYLMGKWCGSGGCNMLVLKRDGNSWRKVTMITITRPPIRVLANTSHGWHNISVWVQGGGIQSGYEAELRFDGNTYPRNPSVSPARRLQGKPVGEVVIPSAQDGSPLYDDH